MTKRRFLLGIIAALLPVAVAVPGSTATMHDVTYISSGSPVVGEDSPKVTTRVHRGEHGLGDAKVFYGTHTGSAGEGDDYLPKTGRLVLAAPSDRSVGVQLVNDDLIEGVEDFEFRLERAEGGTVLRIPTKATVTIATTTARPAFPSPGEGSRTMRIEARFPSPLCDPATPPPRPA